MTEQIFTALFPFGGAGPGALGFLDAHVHVLGRSARFVSLGGIDVDPEACKDFVMLTKSPSLCVDIAKLTPAELRAFAGPKAPDCVFLSPPCKGASGLLSEEKSRTPKYKALNELALVWIELMLRTWDEPPKLVLLENVPRLKSRAGAMLRRLRSALNRAGYVTHDGFHDCGELGGLAQRRRRFLMVARHQGRVPPLLYQPPKRRVRGCGEVLGELPMPGDPAGGPMHRLPRISWLNWVRLALIPAGGDWRDLDGVLEEGQPRRTKFRRHRVEKWDEPSATVGGSGTNGVANVADPRAREWFRGTLGVLPWTEPSGTVTGNARAGTGRFTVADPRVKSAFDHGYAVLRWDEPSSTVAGKSHPGNGAYSVADIRVDSAPRAGAYGVLSWQDVAGTITGSGKLDNGRFSVADPRKPPKEAPVIIAADGTWHRPLTTLELAALQGIPTIVDGQPLRLAGHSTSAWRERIGNAVPPPAARAIAERMLVTLMHAALGAFSLSGDGAVWVQPEARP